MVITTPACASPCCCRCVGASFNRVSHQPFPHAVNAIPSARTNSALSKICSTNRRFSPLTSPCPLRFSAVSAVVLLPTAFLHAKLSQMMIEVLVHQLRPLVRRHLPKERVWICRAALRPRRGKPLHQRGQPKALFAQVPVILHEQTLRRRRVLSHRRLVLERHGLHHRPEDAPQKHPRLGLVPHGPLHSYRAVRHGLRRVHLAPLTLVVGA